MEDTIRRYDIDWLRVIAIGLLIIYHTIIGFQPWGVFIGFIQNNESLDSLWVPMSMLNLWRIPLLFFISGMGVSFALRKRNLKQLLGERTRRIFVPLLFGMIAIVPVHVLIWQKYYSQDLSYQPGQGHLWFLLNIFVYVVLLSPIFYLLKRNESALVFNWLKKALSNPAGLILVVSAFVLETLIVKPESFVLYAMTWHGFWLGLLAFLFGYLFILCGEGLRKNLLKWSWLYLSLAMTLFIFRTILTSREAPDYLLAIESNLWIFSYLGLVDRYLNKPGKTLRYLSRAAYPIYIIHMIFMFLASYVVFPANFTPWIKLLLTVVFTTVGCFVFYEFVIRRVGFLRPLFGLRKKGITNVSSFGTIKAKTSTQNI